MYMKTNVDETLLLDQCIASRTGPSVMAEGHAVWTATSRRENLGYLNQNYDQIQKGGKRLQL